MLATLCNDISIKTLTVTIKGLNDKADVNNALNTILLRVLTSTEHTRT